MPLINIAPLDYTDDNDHNDSDNEPECNAQSHQFIITVKTTN